MEEVKKVRPPPPASGRWKPGQSGNPLGRPKRRPFTDAIERLLQNNPAALDVAAAAMMAKAHNGDVAAFNALCVKNAPWVTRINLGPTIYQFYFANKTDAAICYNYHAAHLYGEFAHLNKISQDDYIHD